LPQVGLADCPLTHFFPVIYWLLASAAALPDV